MASQKWTGIRYGKWFLSVNEGYDGAIVNGALVMNVIPCKRGRDFSVYVSMCLFWYIFRFHVVFHLSHEELCRNVSVEV
jgi:hypothetical protein